MIAKATDDELTNQLDDYLKTTSDSKQDENDWTFDEEKGIYVIHSRRLVMYQLENQWICGDYDSFYTDRYLFDSTLQAWYDTLTEEYSVFDESTQTYVPIDHGRDAGQPLSNQSIRLVVKSSPFYQPGQVVLADANGLSVGRDRSWDCRLRLPEMIVSKYHAMIFWDPKLKQFCLIDNGSQHGTFLNDKRLSEPKQSSLPMPLDHLDRIRIGSTELEVHYHSQTGWPCQECISNSLVDTNSGKKKPTSSTYATSATPEELEESRRTWIKNTKKEYMDHNSSGSSYINRAQIRRMTTQPEKFIKENDTPSPSLPDPSSVVVSASPTVVKGIGAHMLQKLGWQEGQGLGRHQDGVLEPIAPTANNTRSGLGHAQPMHNNNDNMSKKDRQRIIQQQRYYQT
ncbi:SMAD/FHA domain-containing protein [Choanephora cucurbitarum]|nr:SMAD/FHA domain-containing protein [Choanephora cucurbitarum]